MKKNAIYALMSAIALAGVIGFSSCSSVEEEVGEVNPGYNPETGDVPVNFVFSISTNSQGSTRMSAENVQEGNHTFRGIQNARLFSFKTGTAKDGSRMIAAPSYEQLTALDGREYDLDILIEGSALDKEGKPDSRRVLEMSLPSETNMMMMWGRAYRAPLISGNLDAMYGGIEFSPNADLASASFKLKPCVPIDDDSYVGSKALSQFERLIEKALNDIIQAKTTVTATLGERSITNKELAWEDYVVFSTDGDGKCTLSAKEKDPSTDETVALSPLGQILAQLFVSFNTFNNYSGQEELRNGEGKIIAALMGDIYTVISSVIGATATTIEEVAAQRVATRVKNVIDGYFNSNLAGVTEGQDQSTTRIYVSTWKSIDGVISSSGLPSTDVDKIDGSKDLNTFPSGIFHLPPGATIMKYVAVKPKTVPEEGYDIVNEYKYLDGVPTYAMGGGNTTFNPANYMYPAELCYFGNSPIRVTSDTHAVSDYPDGVANWDNDDEWAQNAAGHNNKVSWEKDSHVKTSTRSVAMQENINYGTALLQTTVKYGAATLYDNNDNLHQETPNEISADGDAFSLTGILIGGAVQEVGWNYIAKNATSPNFECMVYDDQIQEEAIPAFSSNKATAPTYTLVWDNFDPTVARSADQRKVFIALEFENKARDFWGMNNLIRKGATFYLIGQLDPDYAAAETLSSLGKTAELYKANKSLGITWPQKYALPPYEYTSGDPFDKEIKTIKERRVFIQDFKTIANFTLGANALKSALVSVPDLRQAQLSLGLSVDLSWSNGLTFDVTLGGNSGDNPGGN